MGSDAESFRLNTFLSITYQYYTLFPSRKQLQFVTWRLGGGKCPLQLPYVSLRVRCPAPLRSPALQRTQCGASVGYTSRSPVHGGGRKGSAPDLEGTGPGSVIMTVEVFEFGQEGGGSSGVRGGCWAALFHGLSISSIIFCILLCFVSSFFELCNQ